MESPTWHKVPLVRILFAFATGIGFSMFFPLSPQIAYSIFFLLFSAYVLCNHLVTSYRKRWVHGVMIYLLFIASGMALHTWQDERNHDAYFTHHENATQLILRVDKPAQEKAKSFRLQAKVLATIDSAHHVTYAAGKVIVYLPKDSSVAMPAYGDVFLINNRLFKPVPPPQNPGEFDYQRYLSFNQIYFQAYARKGEWMKIDTSMAEWVFEKVYAVQQYFKRVLASSIGSANETGVAEALLYGYDDGIDAETVQAYANTGTLHVLAVSGMHVGIIFWILDTMLQWLDKKRSTLLLKQILIIAGLWAYSLLCGLSPSILRATVMFSFIITGKMLNRSVNIYNTLAASACCLLCFDTGMIANVGFQLSYLAVLGIVFIQPYIYNWYAPSSWLADQVWKIIAVSLAAQFTTSPISILYFHQFPLCFLLSNLLIIPLTTIILYTGIGLLVCSGITVVSEWLGKAMYYMIFYTNELVKLIGKIPYAYVNGLRLDIIECLLLYGIVFGMAWYFIFRYRILLQASLVLICLFLASRFANDLVQQQ